MEVEANALVQVVGQTADLADKISGKVRQLDLEQVSSGYNSVTAAKKEKTRGNVEMVLL